MCQHKEQFEAFTSEFFSHFSNNETIEAAKSSRPNWLHLPVGVTIAVIIAEEILFPGGLLIFCYLKWLIHVGEQVLRDIWHQVEKALEFERRRTGSVSSDYKKGSKKQPTSR